MTTPIDSTKLPNFLCSSWRFQQFDEQEAKRKKELDGWTVSSLAETFLQHQLDRHKRFKETQELQRTKLLPLSLILVRKILDELSKSENLDGDVETIANSLNSTTLRQLIRDPTAPYHVLRAFYALPQSHISGNAATAGRRAIDIDEQIIQNERYIRSRGGTENGDGKYLVGLKTFSAIVAPGDKDKFETLTFTRKNPPKGGHEILDELRGRVMQTQSNDAAFSLTFERLTKGILHGLDWSNVFVAGGMALTALIHTEPSKDDDWRVSECDIDVYLYGLNPEQANRKVKDIYNVWSRNLPATNRQKLVVKNAKTINLLADYPNRRIQIVLKLLPSPTDILLNFDLDACAIGFNGSHVSMLPRCARALETGYSVFTMDLIWGHHLGDRRATQDIRVFKYADRGFGLRILPSYAKSLELDHLEALIMHNEDSGTEAVGVVKEPEEVGPEGLPRPSRTPKWDRKPFGAAEPGLKTLKRVAFLGRDFVDRFYFGATPLAVFPNHPSRGNEDEMDDGQEWDDETDWESRVHWDNEEEWKAEYDRALRDKTSTRVANERRRQAGQPLDGPLMALQDIDTRDMHRGLPDGRRGLGNFELFMRHCEAWRLHARADATLDMSDTTSTVYDPITYDDIPTYEWERGFDLAHYGRTIDAGNDNLFDSLKIAICTKLGIALRPVGYRNYLTRRIRRQVCGPDIDSVLAKQITIPLILPWNLENYILSDIPQQFGDFPTHVMRFKPIIPVHDSSRHNPQTSPLPPVQDTVAESGNLRYWVITNESMWAGQHQALDEIAELLWSFFHWFNQSVQPRPGLHHLVGTDVEPCIWQIARSCRRRIVLPEVPSDEGANPRKPSASNPLPPGLPSLRESLLFRPWVFQPPISAKRAYAADGERLYHDLFDEEAVLYPFPDDLFWKEGDEGLWDEAGAPSWTEAEEGKRSKVNRKVDESITIGKTPQRHVHEEHLS